MKPFYIFLCFLLLLSVQSFAQDPTDAGIPDANHVLVVYNSNSLVSDSVMQYYVSARGIPNPLNVVPLPLPDSVEITIDNETHWVGIRQETDIIRDIYNHNTWATTPTKHAFKYFLDNIATPIKAHLVNNNLITTVRYILLVKGVPSKVQSGGDWCCNVRGNVTVSGLLCMLNTPDYDSLIFSTLNNTSGLSNPYRDVDPNFTMDYRFLPDHFNGSNYNLSYLVSHLDGISYDIVKGIIDRSIDPDMSGTAYWILDDDPGWTSGEFIATRNKLDELGFNVFWNDDDTWITSYPEKVMGYTSWGTHAEDYNCNFNDSAWVKDSLRFDLANGSVFNTYESFNGNSLTMLNWRYVAVDPNCSGHTQGLATQFTEIGGTGTMGHAWEPGGDGAAVTNSIFFPAYQMGYNLVDAFYQGLPYLAWQNVLVGDPLLRIYECENTVILSNTTIGDGTYFCDVTVPPNVTLKIEAGSVVNFKRNAQLRIFGTLEIEDNAILNFEGYSKLVLNVSGSVVQNQNTTFNFYDKAKYISKRELTISANQFLIFNNESELVVDRLILNLNSLITFNDSAKLTVSEGMNINPGSELNFLSSSKMKVTGSFICLGESNNKIIFNSATNSELKIENGIVINIANTIFNDNGISVLITSNLLEPELLSITNSTFNSALTGINFTLMGTTFLSTPLISNCTFNDCVRGAITLTQVPEIIIQHSTISLQTIALGIRLINSGVVEIEDCIIIGGTAGITSNVYQEAVPIIETLLCELNIEQCLFETITGIEIAGNNLFNSIIINNNDFQNCVNGITINNFLRFAPVITNNTISGRTQGYLLPSQSGLTLSNGNEALVSNNSITNFLTGINLILVSQPYILSNNISAAGLTVEPLSGIRAISSQGQIRLNTIQNHLYGIELGSSSPKIGANTITNNDAYGIYISDNSNPDLTGSFVGDDQFPLSGYNTIRENGLCTETRNSELYLLSSLVKLEKGCNTIADDRDGVQQQCNSLYLVDGRKIPESIIQARANYWGNHPVYGNDPTGRFGEEVTIDYSDFLPEPCTYSQGEAELILANSKGEVYDTVYSTGNTAFGLSDIESRYATANNYYYNNQYNQAKQEYQGIIQNYGNSNESIQAYNRLYSIASLTNSSPSVFNQLKDFYLQKAANQTDSLIIGTLNHLGDLCLVSAEEYLPAINNFDEIAQQNPNTDIALYRQIDALTTALLLPQDSTMNKGMFVKYSVNGLSDYADKLSELLRTRGKSGLESEEELLPTEYTLYQNYPNPFNPVTTIKYDLPNTSEVTLIIYDILGRKIKELVNTKQQAGKYEVQFDASNLASGVYIYQLVAEKYMQSKKMILLK